VPCISIVNVVGSLIARQTGMGVYLHAGRENAVASTKAFTSQVGAPPLRIGVCSHVFSNIPRFLCDIGDRVVAIGAVVPPNA
jgi:hypothetical protein